MYNLQLEINNRAVGLVEDALGGLNVYNCEQESQECNSIECNKSKQPIMESTQPPANDNYEEIYKYEMNKISKKYSFDIVNIEEDHDNSDLIENSVIEPAYHTEFENVSKNFNEEKSDQKNIYQRIVRVSLNKKKSQGTCFNGNNSYILFSGTNVVKNLNSYLNDINLRFRTYSKNGLILWTSQELNGENDNFLSLSIEDG